MFNFLIHNILFFKKIKNSKYLTPKFDKKRRINKIQMYFNLIQEKTVFDKFYNTNLL